MSAFIDRIRRLYFGEGNAFQTYLDSIKKLKVLVIGDIIIDEYFYGDPVGFSSNEKVPVYNFLEKRTFAGGILAVANHVAGLCNDVTLFTAVGLKNMPVDFIKSNLAANIKAFLLRDGSAGTTIKQRFIDGQSKSRIFKMDYFSQMGLSPAATIAIKGLLGHHLVKYDLVLVVDFGHGLIDPATAEIIGLKSKYLALNVQTNPTNFGKNLATKYPRADYLSLNALELALAPTSAGVSRKCMLEELRQKMVVKNLAVTLGEDGSLLYDGKDFLSVPIIKTDAQDAVGAGDAFLSVSSLFAAVGAPLDLVGFMGAAAGSWAAGIIGHEKYLTLDNLRGVIDGVLQ